MAYRPGELDQLITFERQSITPDGLGGGDLSWTLLGQVWAHVRPRSGREITDFERVNDHAVYLFVIRWPIDIREDDRILWEGDYYNIRALKSPKTRNLYCEIEAERGAGT